MSKLSTTPVAVILFVAGLHPILRGPSTESKRPALALALAPWLIFVLPIVLWEWAVSGAPAGPFLASWLPGSAYDSVPVRALMIGEPASFTEIVAGWSPVVWCGMIGAIAASRMSGAKRALLGALVLVQAAFIVALITRHPRFLGGLTYCSAMLFAIAPPRPLMTWIQAPRARAMVLVVFIAPLVAVSAYYARPFAQVVFGLESPEHFREQFVGNYADFRALDSLLPANAVLLATESALGVCAAFHRLDGSRRAAGRSAVPGGTAVRVRGERVRRIGHDVHEPACPFGGVPRSVADHRDVPILRTASDCPLTTGV